MKFIHSDPISTRSSFTPHRNIRHKIIFGVQRDLQRECVSLPISGKPVERGSRLAPNPHPLPATTTTRDRPLAFEKIARIAEEAWWGKVRLYIAGLRYTQERTLQRYSDARWSVKLHRSSGNQIFHHLLKNWYTVSHSLKLSINAIIFQGISYQATGGVDNSKFAMLAGGIGDFGPRERQFPPP